MVVETLMKAKSEDVDNCHSAFACVRPYKDKNDEAVIVSVGKNPVALFAGEVIEGFTTCGTASEASFAVVIAPSAILLVVIVPSPTKEPEMPFEIFAEKIVAPVFARNEILLSESVLIDDTTICPAIMIP
jgi:hypothetical protein